MLEDKLKNITAIVFDVDGVLTNGGILANEYGDLFRVFDSKDGFAIRLAHLKGYHLGAITGGKSISITKRLLTLGFREEDIYLSSRDKVAHLNDYCLKNDIKPEEIMYLGDDIPDIGVMKLCGLGVCPSDAAEEVKAIADYISEYKGGRLFARKTIEMLMKMQGKWNFDVTEYKDKF